MTDRKSERAFLPGISVHANAISDRFFLFRIAPSRASPFSDLDWRGFAMADIPKVVTAKVAARFVGLSESTLAKLRLNGNGPVYCKLEQWLQSRTTRDTSDADARFLRALTAAHPRRLADMTNPTRAKDAVACFMEIEEGRLCVKTEENVPASGE